MVHILTNPMNLSLVIGVCDPNETCSSWLWTLQKVSESLVMVQDTHLYLEVNVLSKFTGTAWRVVHAVLIQTFQPSSFSHSVRAYNPSVAVLFAPHYNRLTRIIAGVLTVLSSLFLAYFQQTILATCLPFSTFDLSTTLSSCNNSRFSSQCLLGFLLFSFWSFRVVLRRICYSKLNEMMLQLDLIWL